MDFYKSEENYLAHYGVIGMRWGHRKWKPSSISKRNTNKYLNKKSNTKAKDVKSGSKTKNKKANTLVKDIKHSSKIKNRVGSILNKKNIKIKKLKDIRMLDLMPYVLPLGIMSEIVYRGYKYNKAKSFYR